MFSLRPAACAALALWAGCVGCAGSNDGTPDASVEGGVSCTSDPRLDEYSGELDKAGERGALSFRFFNLDPAPPAKGLNTFHVEVRGSGGEGSGGEGSGGEGSGGVMPAQLRVSLHMPDHGHGTSVEPIISADTAPGTYIVQQLFLFMPGVWRLEFEALDAPDEDAAVLDSAVLHFCVEG